MLSDTAHILIPSAYLLLFLKLGIWSHPPESPLPNTLASGHYVIHIASPGPRAANLA